VTVASAVTEAGWAVVHFDITRCSRPQSRNTRAHTANTKTVARAVVRAGIDYNVALRPSESSVAVAHARETCSMTEAQSWASSR
jgi:hypothetical protein